MGTIAASALAFAFLPLLLSVSLAVTIWGVLVIDGMRLPMVTGGVRRWLLWGLLSVALAACPVTVAVVGTMYEHTGPPAFSGPRPWATHVVDQVCLAHLWVSVVASVMVAMLTRGGYRWLAWAAVLTIGAFTWLLGFGAVMATTGIYL